MLHWLSGYHVRHRKQKHRQAQCDRYPKAARRHGELRIFLHVDRSRSRLERHPADRASPGPRSHDLRMHGTRVLNLLRFRTARRRMPACGRRCAKKLSRLRSEFRCTAFGAKVVCLSAVLALRRGRFRLARHSANWISLHRSLFHLPFGGDFVLALGSLRFRGARSRPIWNQVRNLKVKILNHLAFTSRACKSIVATHRASHPPRSDCPSVSSA